MSANEYCPRCNGTGEIKMTKGTQQIWDLLAKGPMRTHEIAKRLKIEYPAALARLQRMNGRGLIERGTDLCWRRP